MLHEKARFTNNEIQASTIGSLMKPAKLLLEMDDVTGVNWNKLAKMMPAARPYALQGSNHSGDAVDPLGQRRQVPGKLC